MIRDDAKIIITPTSVLLEEALTSEETNAINEAHIYRGYDCIPHFKLAGNPPSGKESHLLVEVQEVATIVLSAILLYFQRLKHHQMKDTLTFGIGKYS